MTMMINDKIKLQKIAPSSVVNEEERRIVSFSSSKSSGNPIAKTVTFNHNVIIRATLHLDQYTKSEIESTWYSRQEYSGMMQEARELLEEVTWAEHSKVMRWAPPCAQEADHYQSSDSEQDTCDFKKEAQEDEQYLMLGLELRIPHSRKEVLARREMASIAVFRAQNAQYSTRRYDPEIIADAYLPISTISRNAALDRAQRLYEHEALPVEHHDRCASSRFDCSQRWSLGKRQYALVVTL